MKFKKNLISSYFYFFVVALLNFLTSTLMVTSVGASALGILRTSQRIADIFLILDGRASQYMKWDLMGLNSQSDSVARATIASAARLTFILFTCCLVLFSIVCFFFLRDEETSAVFWVFFLINFILLALIDFLDSIYLGFYKGHASKFAMSLGVTISICLVSALHFFGVLSLASFAIAMSFSSLVSLLTLIWFMPARLKLFELLSSSLVPIGLHRVKDFQIWAIVERVIIGAEVILLTFFSSKVASASYSLIIFSWSFLLSVTLLLGSSCVQYCKKYGNPMVFHAAKELLLVTACIGSVFLMLINENFIKIWVGPQYWLEGWAPLIVPMNFFIIMVIRIFSQFQDAEGSTTDRRFASILMLGFYMVLFAFLYALSIEAVDIILVLAVLVKLPLLLTVVNGNWLYKLLLFGFVLVCFAFLYGILGFIWSVAVFSILAIPICYKVSTFVSIMKRGVNN